MRAVLLYQAGHQTLRCFFQRWTEDRLRQVFLMCVVASLQDMQKGRTQQRIFVRETPIDRCGRDTRLDRDPGQGAAFQSIPIERSNTRLEQALKRLAAAL